MLQSFYIPTSSAQRITLNFFLLFFFTIWYYVTFLIVVLICIFLQFMRLNIFHIYWTFVMSSAICLFRWFAHSLKLGPVVYVPSLTNIVPRVRLFLTGWFSKHLHTAEVISKWWLPGHNLRLCPQNSLFLSAVCIFHSQSSFLVFPPSNLQEQL